MAGAFTSRPATVAGGPWEGHSITKLSVTTTDLARLTVVGEGDEALSVVRVPGTDEIDVHLFFGQPEASGGGVLSTGLRTLGQGRPIAEHAEGGAAPGVVVETIERSEPESLLVVDTPGFEVAAEHDLLSRAGLFGLTAASDGSEGHFPGVSPDPLYVGAARQDALARFGAEGFLASAVTAIGLALAVGPAPEPTETFEVTRYRVTIDRPFGFAAVHRPTSLVIAAGWVARPPTAPVTDDGGGESGHESGHEEFVPFPPPMPEPDQGGGASGRQSGGLWGRLARSWRRRGPGG